MNCPEAYEAIQRYLDGDEPTATLNEHLPTCRRCRRDFATAQLLRHGLRDLPRPEAPVTSVSRLIEVVDRDTRFRRSLGWWRNAWILATAASLLAFVAYGLLHRETPPDAPNDVGALAVKDVGPHEPTKTDAVPRTADAEKAVTALAQAVQENAQAQIHILIAAANPLDQAPTLTPIDVDPPLDPALQAAQSFRSAGRNMAETFEPMATSARQAALFFAREIPVDFQMREN
jgi:predicted anti-sigma-YlaC factor YlaD